METMYDIFVSGQEYKLRKGQRFYHNNYSVEKGLSLPDYLILDGIKVVQEKNWVMYFLNAKYENHSVYTAERALSEVILMDSNLNPKCEHPEWIFESISQKMQPV